MGRTMSSLEFNPEPERSEAVAEARSPPAARQPIAATALVHRLIVVTRNFRDFEPMGV